MNFLKGNKVHVKNNISYTLNTLGGGKEMKKMAGGQYVIVTINANNIRLDGKELGYWWFKRKDLIKDMTDEELGKKIIQQHPPVMFDINNIVT